MSNNTGNTLIALITGAAVGAGIGLLYAPKSGKETRDQLKGEASSLKDKLGKEYEKISSQANDFAKDAKGKFEKRVDKLFKKANNEADDILSSMESELEILRKKNEELAKELESLKV